MEYNFDMSKICRICLELEDSMLTSIFNTDFAMMPAAMMMLCAKVKVYPTDSKLIVKPMVFMKLIDAGVHQRWAAVGDL